MKIQYSSEPMKLVLTTTKKLSAENPWDLDLFMQPNKKEKIKMPDYTIKIETITKLASFLAKQEALKKQVSIGNVRELLGILSDLAFADEEILNVIWRNGKRRAKKKKK